MKIKDGKTLLKRIPTTKTQTKHTKGAKMAPKNGNGHVYRVHYRCELAERLLAYYLYFCGTSVLRQIFCHWQNF